MIDITSHLASHEMLNLIVHALECTFPPNHA
jgi:hypothetical protein